jgi:hypothetical protein
MSKSIHTTVAGTARNNTRAELNEPDNADVAELVKKTRYKKQQLARRKSNEFSATSAHKPGREKA